MSKDPFQILADELTLIRKDMDRLQRASLDKDEAEALHQIVAEAVTDMQRTTREAPQALQTALKSDRDRMAQFATEAATRAAERVLGDIREQLAQERQKLSQAAGEARREAWRWFGGFWVWLASIGAAGALLGALAAFWIGGEIAAREFGDYPGIFCSGAGGQVVEQDNGSSYCAIWINRPEQ
jgi:biopolymer transport protein ExbB/TolQ